MKDFWLQYMSEFKYVTNIVVNIKNYKNIHDFVQRLLSSLGVPSSWDTMKMVM